MYEEDDPQQPNTQINETLGREVSPAHPARPIIPLIPPTAQPAMESSSSSTSQPEIETREPAVVTILEPELGRGQRRRQPPVTLKNFITNSAQTRLLGSSSNGKELMYPITNYVSYGRFSACHTDYQVSTGKITPPKSYKKAVEDEWFKKAMGTEITALEGSRTWDVVDLPPGKTAIGCKWVYTVKYRADGPIERFKARLVALGNKQVEGVDYKETFAPVAKMGTVTLFGCSYEKRLGCTSNGCTQCFFAWRSS